MCACLHEYNSARFSIHTFIFFQWPTLFTIHIFFKIIWFHYMSAEHTIVYFIIIHNFSLFPSCDMACITFASILLYTAKRYTSLHFCSTTFIQIKLANHIFFVKNFNLTFSTCLKQMYKYSQLFLTTWASAYIIVQSTIQSSPWWPAYRLEDIVVLIYTSFQWQINHYKSGLTIEWTTVCLTSNRHRMNLPGR